MRVFPTLIAGCGVLANVAFAQADRAVSAAPRASAAPTQVTQGIAGAKLERVAPNRGILTVALKSEVAANMRLFDGAGKEVAVARTAEGALKADIDPQRGYILAPPAAGRVTLNKDGQHFPARYVTFSPAGATNLGGLFLRPAVVPLTWNDQARAYTTELFVGYEFEDGRETTLGAPKTVTFFAEGANARIQADTVTVTRSGGPGYQRVVLSTGQVDGETHFTARANAVDELKTSVAVLRELGGLRLSLPSTELAAYGVGSSTLTVSLLARDGMPMNAMKPVDIQLSSRGVRLPALARVEPGNSTTTVEVRTVGAGADQVTAQTGTMRATLPVRLIFPVAPVVAAIVGGALGGVARFVRNKRKGSALLGRRVIEGVLVGVILVGAAWAGLVSVDVSTGILGTPFGAFVLAALSGYLGCVVLDRVAKKTFGGVKEATS